MEIVGVAGASSLVCDTLEICEKVANPIKQASPKTKTTLQWEKAQKKAAELKKGRHESPDQHESSELHLKNAENAYLELADIHHYETIKCVDRKNNLRPIEEIHEEIYKIIIEKLY